MKNILIVDDDRDVFESMKIVLEADLMILDVMMNTDDEGFQVTYTMKQDPQLSCIPIVMVTSVGARTGFSFDRKKDEDFLAVNEFLEKPVDPRTLVDKVRENLGG
jgi:CheY-like chemotaxis protein